MTDEILIAWLREYREINEGSTGVSYDPIPECLAAADRIELLATTNEQLVATNEALSISNATLIAERDEAMQLLKTLSNMNGDLSRDLYKTKLLLAKAAEGLKRICMQPDYRLPSPQEIARATLAEIKKPIAEWPEETGNIMVGKLKGESHE